MTTTNQDGNRIMKNTEKEGMTKRIVACIMLLEGIYSPPVYVSNPTMISYPMHVQLAH